MDLTNIGTIKEVMERHGIKFQKKFGQNFLVTPSLPLRIAQSSGINENSCVLEIGPGIGTLTYALCQRAKKVLAVEIDQGLIPVLEETLAEFDNVKVINEDIMKLDIKELMQKEFGSEDVFVCANLPYYITTPILMGLLECGYPFRSMTFMVQKEVADRLCATSESQEYGAVTASVNYYGRMTRLFNVGKGNFMPAPKVDSAVIQIELYKDKPYKPLDEKTFFDVIRFAFEMRRKTLVNALSGKTGLSKECLYEMLDEMGLDRNIRGERLSVKEFALLADLIYKQKNK